MRIWSQIVYLTALLLVETASALLHIANPDTTPFNISQYETMNYPLQSLIRRTSIDSSEKSLQIQV
jgi:hypothetical protein